MPPHVRPTAQLWAGVATFLVLVGLTAQVHGQDRATPAGPAAAEGRSEPPAASENDNESENEPAETRDFIETDRNSFTFARVTPGADRLIVESSYSYINLSGEKIKNSFPELLLRYGIGDRFELRLGWNYETGRERMPGGGDIAGFFGANAEQQL